MKKNIFLALFVGLSLVACKNSKKDVVETTDADQTTQTATGETTKVTMSTDNSHVEWLGSKAVGGSHNGKIQFKSGEFDVADGKVVGGNFIVDMTSITDEDIEDPKDNKNLVDHLSNNDFFEVETYPTASFKILNVKAAEDGSNLQDVTGVLTIKGTAKEITVPAVISVDGEKVSFATEFNIDRTEFGVVYGSASKIENLAKEKAINDVIELKVIANS